MNSPNLPETNQVINDEIRRIIHQYLEKTSKISDYKQREEHLLEMLSLLLNYINDIAREGDYYEVADNITSAAYYMEEFDYREAQRIYETAIEYYEKYMNQLQKSGKFEEAAWTANHIAEIYHNKLNNLDKETEYLHKCIKFSEALIELSSGFMSSRKLAIQLYNLGDLYAKVGNWYKSIEVNEKGLEIAKEEKFYDIVANIYFNSSDVYLFQGKEDESNRILQDAQDYFAFQEEECEQTGNHYKLSQIYQIQKNFHSAMNNGSDFKHYCRKEAVSYTNMAKTKKKEGVQTHKIASLYRGTGLCLKETEETQMESATAFLVAGHMYQKIDELLESSLCYNDAAEMFEELGVYERAIQYYELASEIALENGDFEFAIEKLMCAYDLAEIENFNKGRNKIANKIINNLKKISLKHKKKEQNFIAGTLLLEALPYYQKLGYANDSEIILHTLKEISKCYCDEYLMMMDSGNGKNTTTSYILSLAAISKIALEEYDKAENLASMLDNEQSTIMQSYRRIVLGVMDAHKKGIKFDLSIFDSKTKKLFSKSEEIKLFNNFLFF